jgi:hypothetical protein
MSRAEATLLLSDDGTERSFCRARKKNTVSRIEGKAQGCPVDFFNGWVLNKKN